MHCNVSWASRLALVGSITALVACSPALDWRELRWVGDTTLMMPCKPEQLSRSLTLAGQPVKASMWVCDAQGSTWSATAYELPSDGLRDAALAEASRLLVANLGASDVVEQPRAQSSDSSTVAGRRSVVKGHRPGGEAVKAQALFAARGRWVMQLVVLSPAGDDAAAAGRQGGVDEFLGSLRLARNG